MDAKYISDLLSDDWGFYKTFTINYDRVKEFLNGYPEYAKSILGNLQTIMGMIESHPKSMKWKLRAKVGEKVKWYEEPEEVKAS